MTEHRAMTARVTGGGRIVIPAAVRKALEIKPGDEVFLEVEDDALRITSRRLALRRVQDRIAKRARPGISLADELIQERREEARERRK
jgi:AbrB family looped-hinge helix DNA binding protein